MQQKTRMTFRFDGAEPRETTQPQHAAAQEQPIEARRNVAAHAPASRGTEHRRDNRDEPREAETLDAWQSPYQDDIHALEEIIRRSNPADPQTQPIQPAPTRVRRQARKPARSAALAPTESAPEPHRTAAQQAAERHRRGERLDAWSSAAPKPEDWPTSAPKPEAWSTFAPKSEARPTSAPKPGAWGEPESSPARPSDRDMAPPRDEASAEADSNLRPDLYRTMPVRAARGGGFSAGRESSHAGRESSHAGRESSHAGRESSNTGPNPPSPHERVQPQAFPAEGRKSVAGFSGLGRPNGQPNAPVEKAMPHADEWQDAYGGSHAPYSDIQGEGPELEPGLDEPRNHGWMSQAYTRRREGPSWLRIFVSVAGAIVTGAVFGYLVLALFTGEPLFPGSPSGPSAPVVADVQPSPGTSQPPGASPASASPPADKGAAGSESGAKPVQGAASAVAPASVYYLLQYGVFGTEASMNDAVKQLTGKGLPAASDTTDGFRVYAGIAPTKEAAAALAKTMAGTEVYVKALESQQLDLSDNAQADRWAAYLKTSDALTRSLSKLASDGLQQEKTQAPAAEETQALELSFAAWQQASQGLETWSDAAKTEALAHASQLSNAVKAFREHAKTPSKASLRQMQSSAMAAALGANRLRLDLQLGSGS
ncbi:SPOR domain-containing protein [Cohnella sp. REN36]|uniref:SPOR domain-containing protein n=1 Tax=Cohnella sp. REN36 TaxID=2887347 RepID=UPI001D147439|nr:SPOR domain-containing protein [Cohnella sp. REN36]MCC3376902.1 SPOR domain-containing protein [Cohnella sp. REN36]